jgi:hypothetical protein
LKINIFFLDAPQLRSITLRLPAQHFLRWLSTAGRYAYIFTPPAACSGVAFAFLGNAAGSSFRRMLHYAGTEEAEEESTL